jgi:hypothetical protein
MYLEIAPGEHSRKLGGNNDNNNQLNRQRLQLLAPTM